MEISHFVLLIGVFVTVFFLFEYIKRFFVFLGVKTGLLSSTWYLKRQYNKAMNYYEKRGIDPWA